MWLMYNIVQPPHTTEQYVTHMQHSSATLFNRTAQLNIFTLFSADNLAETITLEHQEKTGVPRKTTLQ